MTVDFHRFRRPHFVYRQFDADGVLLYVGCTKHPEQREAEHRSNSAWAHLIASVEYEMHANRPVAIAHEQHAIATESPLFNQLGSSDPAVAHMNVCRSLIDQETAS